MEKIYEDKGFSIFKKGEIFYFLEEKVEISAISLYIINLKTTHSEISLIGIDYEDFIEESGETAEGKIRTFLNCI